MGKKSYVVLEKSENFDGLVMIGHPYIHRERAEERVVEYANKYPGVTFYAAEIYAKKLVEPKMRGEVEYLD